MEDLVKDLREAYNILKEEINEDKIHQFRKFFKRFKAIYLIDSENSIPIKLKTFYKLAGDVRDIQILNKFETIYNKPKTSYSFKLIEKFLIENPEINLPSSLVYPNKDVILEYVIFNIRYGLKTEKFYSIEDVHKLRKTVKKLLFLIRIYGFKDLGEILLEKAEENLGEWHDRQINLDKIPELSKECYNYMQDGLENIRILKRFQCMDCGISTFHDDKNYYMLNNDLWKSIVPNIDGMLCIHCVEERLGRKVKYDDFSDVPLNHHWNGYVQQLKD